MSVQRMCSKRNTLYFGLFAVVGHMLLEKECLTNATREIFYKEYVIELSKVLREEVDLREKSMDQEGIPLGCLITQNVYSLWNSYFETFTKR